MTSVGAPELLIVVLGLLCVMAVAIGVVVLVVARRSPSPPGRSGQQAPPGWWWDGSQWNPPAGTRGD